MKRIRVVYIVVAVLILEILLSTMAYNEPSFTTVNVERFDVSRITQNHAVNVVDEKWAFSSSTNYLEISMRKASAFERSLYAVGVPTNTPLFGDSTFHARVFVSNLNVNDDVIRAFVVLVNETHVIESNYCIGRKLEDEIPSPNVPAHSYLYMSVSKASDGWVTVDRDIVGDLASKNVSIETDGSWRISKFCIGGMLYQKSESAALSMLIDVDQTYLDLGVVKVFPDNASVNTPIVLLIAGLFVFSCIVLVVESVTFQRRNGHAGKILGSRSKLSSARFLSAYNSHITPALLVILVQATFIFRLMFLNYPSFQSDESVYSYASLALTKGLVPYREIALYQPPLQYLLMASISKMSGPGLVALRLMGIIIQEACIVLVYLAARNYFQRFPTDRCNLLALASSVVFGCYSTLLFYLFPLNESLFTLLTLGAFTLFLRANGRRDSLFICGVFLGLSVLTKYYGVFFSIGFSILALLNRKGSKSFGFIKANLTDLSCMIIGGVAVCIPFLLILTFVWKALPNFLTQTVYWYAFGKYSPPPEHNFMILRWVADSYTMLIWAGLIGVFALFYWYQRTRELLILAPPVILAVSFLFFISEISSSKWTFFHYFWPLLPYLSIITVSSFLFLGKLADSRGGPKNAGIVLIIIAIIFMAGYSNFQYLSSLLPEYYSSPNTVNALERHIGLAVKNLTHDGDAIWTSEGAIGFFADRIIVAPNSSSWPVRACYSEIFSYHYMEYKGDQSHYPNGCVTVKDFLQAWESQKTKVLVFIKGQGYIPYPDELLWNGFRGQIGVKSYVETNYRLYTRARARAYSYIYEVWVRKT